MRIKRLPDRQRRVFKEFAKELDEIKIARIKLGIDKKPMSDARLTRGISKDPDWIFTKERLKRMPRDPRFGRKAR